MKKYIFLIFTVLSVISYAGAGLLLGIHFTENSAGMIMIFLIPLLVFGLLTGITAWGIKKTKNLELSQVLGSFHYLNLILMFLGLITLIYVFFE